MVEASKRQSNYNSSATFRQHWSTWASSLVLRPIQVRSGYEANYRPHLMEWSKTMSTKMKAKKIIVGVSPSCLGRAMVASFLSIEAFCFTPLATVSCHWARTYLWDHYLWDHNYLKLFFSLGTVMILIWWRASNLCRSQFIKWILVLMFTKYETKIFIQNTKTLSLVMVYFCIASHAWATHLLQWLESYFFENHHFGAYIQ